MSAVGYKQTSGDHKIASALLPKADITVQTCWDADRLELGRVGTMPKAEYLCTDAGKDLEMIEWAHGRAVNLS
jgi:hypothetical protein